MLAEIRSCRYPVVRPGEGSIRPVANSAPVSSQPGAPNAVDAFQQQKNLKIIAQIAAELKARPAQVIAAVELLDGGASVPFIARYRKEATDGLDDIQLRELEVRLAYLRELEDRRAAVLKSISEQGKLTAGTGRRHRRGADQAGAGRPVSAVQDQAPHQGDDRPRGRHRATGRCLVCRSVTTASRCRGCLYCRLRRRSNKARRGRFCHPAACSGTEPRPTTSCAACRPARRLRPSAR